MDIATLAGFIFGAACTVISIVLGGPLAAFYDVPSILITVGGGMATVLISYRLSDIGKIMKVVANAFSNKKSSPENTIRLLVDLSNKARREGLLSLDSDQEQIEDPYIQQSLQMIVDGVEPESIRECMELELSSLEARHDKGKSLFKNMSTIFPAWGMIGTLIGLINLLKGLDDPSKVGPSMAVALITTFYGSILANFVCIPIANKLSFKSKEEVQIKEMIIEGILSIQAGENPRIMEYKLKTFLSPEQKLKYSQQPEEASKQDDTIGETADR